MRKASYLFTAASLMAASLMEASSASAAVFPASDFRTFRATTATVISGETTNDPVVGALVDADANGTADQTAAAARIVGYFSPQTLTNAGDSITLTFSVTFADVTGTASGQDNFRFALFDRNGEPIEPTLNTAAVGSTNTEDFRGYIVGVDSGTAAPQGSVRERINSTSVDAFAAGTAAALGASNTGTNVTIDDGPTYTGSLTLTLNGSGGVDISATFNGNGGGNVFAVTDSATPFTTFGAVGFLNGSAINTDQLSFQDVNVTFIPEPATAGLLGLGALALRRRRQI